VRRTVRGCLCALLFTPMAHSQDWPRVPLPREVQVFDIGQQVTLNALPMRLQGFVSQAAPDKVVELFRHSLGKPLVETTLETRRILGRVEGEFYLSVQIEPAGQGSRGTTAVTHLKAGYESQEQTRLQREHLLSRLPTGSQVLSLMASKDGAQLSRHMVFSNGHSESLNRDRLKRMLQEDGLAFELEGNAIDSSASAAPSGSGGVGQALFFKGREKEALATIHRNNDGLTTVVVNVVTHTERLR
jgi:hypothetical protein